MSFIILLLVFVKLAAWRLELVAWRFGPAPFFFFNFRLCRARSAASPVFQEIVLYMLNR